MLPSRPDQGLDFSGDQHVGLIFINHKQKGYLLEVKEEEIDGE